MKIKVHVVIESDEETTETIENIIHLERGNLHPEDLGLTLADTILAGEHRPLNQLETEFGEDLESPLASPDINPGV